MFTDEYKKTVAVDFLQKKKFIKSVDREVEFNIWDTAGQEYFDAITKKYYRGAQVAIFVFSVSDRDSFNSIKSWKDKVLDVCGQDIPMLLVMNKIDLPENEKKVSDEEAVRLAAGVEMYLFRTSVKDNIKINEIFDTAAYEFFNKGINVKPVHAQQSVNELNKKEEDIKEIVVTKKPKPTNVSSNSKLDNNNQGFKINTIPNDSDKKNSKKNSSCC